MDGIKNRQNAVLLVGLTFIICNIGRFFEYFVLQTDKTILAENVWHKLFGIAVLAVAMILCKYSLSDIGANTKKFLKHTLAGILLSVGVYVVSYGIELIIGLSQNSNPHFGFYATSFSIAGEPVVSSSVLLILLCVLMNVINVIMEEGLFRGFYDKVLSEKSSFWKRTLIISLLFGFWHITMTIRSVVEGEMDIGAALFMTVGYVFLAGMMSIKWSLLKRLYGTIWIGMGEHFFSNTITNLLHVVSDNGTDEMQIVRVMVANIISFTAILVWYIIKTKGKKNNPTNN